ncbi:hypothetical protein PIB30_081105 [Stylosanthes scabra]|uniref:DUF4283 domain-containing protein n=1 Tax=Stylosanthes scabra TaxID=79078 RepID=A0ABU6QS76_9FABA|nr:hypothetical protein [Stylosanthes scabra]
MWERENQREGDGVMRDQWQTVSRRKPVSHCGQAKPPRTRPKRDIDGNGKGMGTRTGSKWLKGCEIRLKESKFRRKTKEGNMRTKGGVVTHGEAEIYKIENLINNHKEQVKMLGPMKLRIIFDSKQSMKEAYNSLILLNYFLETRKWSKTETNTLRRLWIEVIWLPLYGWSMENMRRIGEV